MYGTSNAQPHLAQGPLLHTHVCLGTNQLGSVGKGHGASELKLKLVIFFVVVEHQ